jgi:aspartyl-tRNA(Asn)/glutamyl-tRNA(Gln) amidotransferase subunit A
MNASDSDLIDVEIASGMIRRRELTAAALVDRMLDRIASINPKLNAYVTVLAESARQQALAVDAELDRGAWRGPLHGMTFAVKDMIHVADAPTRAGSRSVGHLVAASDATCVAKLRAAGAIVLGKLHTHELAGGATSENELYGRARNPWNLDYIPGGSSGGSAIAAAAGLLHGALGTDTGGSVRIPAAFCGVVGLKGTFGSVSRNGVLMRSWTMDHVGTIARRVKDAALFFEAIAGHDEDDPYSSRRAGLNIVPRLDGDVRGLRAGVLGGDFFEAQLDPEIRTAFEAAVRTLESLGLQTTPVQFELAAASHSAGTLITMAEADSTQDEKLREAPDEYGADIRSQLRVAEFISARQYLRALRIRSRARHELESLFERVDVLLTPTTSTLPVRSDGTTSSEGLSLFARNTRPFSVSGLPAISVPAAFSMSGLPIGLQIIGQPFDEADMLRVAYAYEQTTPWHRMLPGCAQSSVLS